jgi:L-lactate dehydrogenase complex protein LldE
MSSSRPRVALFVTCLVDLHRPSIGFAAIRLLEEAGCQVEVPRAQTCCGQPAYNSGDRATTRDLAVSILDTFGGYDHVVVPSGSCGGMLKHHLPHLFDDDPNLRARADALSVKTFELVSFLTDVVGVERLQTRYAGGPVTYHDSCSGLRELGIKDQPRKLLQSIGATIAEMPDPEVCCSDKVRDIIASGAETVVAGDLGCLLNIAGRLQREGHRTMVRHVAEVLAGMTGQVPPIGEGRQ